MPNFIVIVPTSDISLFKQVICDLIKELSPENNTVIEFNVSSQYRGLFTKIRIILDINNYIHVMEYLKKTKYQFNYTHDIVKISDYVVYNYTTIPYVDKAIKTYMKSYVHASYNICHDYIIILNHITKYKYDRTIKMFNMLCKEYVHKTVYINSRKFDRRYILNYMRMNYIIYNKNDSNNTLIMYGTRLDILEAFKHFDCQFIPDLVFPKNNFDIYIKFF